METEELCIMIAMVVTQIYTLDKIAQNYTHTHAHTQVHVILVKSEQVLWIVLMPTSKFDMYCNYIRCDSWGKLGAGHTGLCCTVFFNFLLIYGYLQIKHKMRLIVCKREHDFICLPCSSISLNLYDNFNFFPSNNFLFEK